MKTFEQFRVCPYVSSYMWPLPSLDFSGLLTTDFMLDSHLQVHEIPLLFLHDILDASGRVAVLVPRQVQWSVVDVIREWIFDRGLSCQLLDLDYLAYRRRSGDLVSIESSGSFLIAVGGQGQFQSELDALACPYVRVVTEGSIGVALPGDVVMYQILGDELGVSEALYSRTKRLWDSQMGGEDWGVFCDLCFRVFYDGHGLVEADRLFFEPTTVDELALVERLEAVGILVWVEDRIYRFSGWDWVFLGVCGHGLSMSFILPRLGLYGWEYVLRFWVGALSQSDGVSFIQEIHRTSGGYSGVLYKELFLSGLLVAEWRLCWGGFFRRMAGEYCFWIGGACATFASFWAVACDSYFGEIGSCYYCVSVVGVRD